MKLIEYETSCYSSTPNSPRYERIIHRACIDLVKAGMNKTTLTVCFLILVSVFLSGCANNRCNGWQFHLIDIQSQESSGWTNFFGTLAVENINARPIMLPDFSLLKDELTTAEGYSYPVRYGTWSTYFRWVPPGFRYHLGEKFNASGIILETSASSGTTKRTIDTGCGIINLDEPEVNLIYPTDNFPSSFLSPGDSISIPDGSLTIHGITNDNTDYSSVPDAKVRCTATSINQCIYITFSNINKGYDTTTELTLVYLGNDGFAQYANQIFHAGPGQNQDYFINFRAMADSNRVLIIYKDDSKDFWAINLDK